MKTQICLFAIGFLFTGMAQAQKLKESDVPATVKATFAQSFPNANGVRWSKESASEFEAEFKNGKVEQSANFDGTGNWVVTETEINKSELPAAVQASINKEFDGYKIEEAEKVETPDKGVFYEVHVEKGRAEFSLEISPDGKIMKKEEAKEDDDK